MDGAASHGEEGGHSQRLYENCFKGFYRKKGVAGGLLAKGKKGLFLDQAIFFYWGMGLGQGKGFFMQIVSSPRRGGEGPCDR